MNNIIKTKKLKRFKSLMSNVKLTIICNWQILNYLSFKSLMSKVKLKAITDLTTDLYNEFQISNE